MPKPVAVDAARANLSYLREVTGILQKGGIVSAEAEARTLVRHFSGARLEALYAGQAEISRPVRRRLGQVLQKRLSRVPLQHLTGSAPFYGREFKVGPEVLVPRPETEVLLEQTLAHLGPNPAKVLEIGVGSGCLAVSLTIERPDCKMTALDLSEKALRLARKNAKIQGVSRKIRFLKSDLFAVFGGRFRGDWDLIVSNPPYLESGALKRLPPEVRREPKLALDGGRDGLVVVRRILEEAPLYLKKGGWLLLEIGDDQSDKLSKNKKILKDYSEIRFVKDLNGIERILIAKRNG